MSETIKTRIPFGKIHPDKTNAVFLVIYVESISPWKYFKDEFQHKECPAVIMIDRWDGRMGFPGGTMEKDEPILEALSREIKEEIGISIRTDQMIGIASFEWKIVTHLYGMRVTETEFFYIYYHILNNFSRSILLHAHQEGDASHFLSEITGIKIVPLLNHQGKGIGEFMKNNFAGSAKEELAIFIEEILKLDY